MVRSQLFILLIHTRIREHEIKPPGAVLKAKKGRPYSCNRLDLWVCLLNGIVTEQLMLAGTSGDCLLKAPFSEKKFIKV